MQNCQRQKLYFNRFAFIALHSEGKILDVGCADGGIWIHGYKILNRPFDYLNSNIYYFDIDLWSHPRFTRGDANRLPFKNSTFDTVVAGEIVEHISDPVILIKELIRVSKNKIVITVPNEYQWKDCQFPFRTREEHAQQEGITPTELDIQNTLGLKFSHAICLDYTDESTLKHLYHQRYFTGYSFTKLLLDIIGQYNHRDTNPNSTKILDIEINHLYSPVHKDLDTAYISAIIYKNDNQKID